MSFCHSIMDVAASQLQRCVRQRLVAQYWRLELRAFWCPLCGEIQLPPRQRCLYVKQADVTFKNVCGLARRCKRCDYDRCSKNQPRKRNENMRCRHELFSRMCEETEVISINMLRTALVHENRMILTCTKYVRVSVCNLQKHCANFFQVCQSNHN